MGERGEPWGTPCSDEKGEEEKPGKHRLVDLSERKEEKIEQAIGGYTFS
jgi:hypothetical protein